MYKHQPNKTINIENMNDSHQSRIQFTLQLFIQSHNRQIHNSIEKKKLTILNTALNYNVENRNAYHFTLNT
ncbi:hypothetical protein VNO77_22209 [Canavalia gladiata]|uniref:Uncharacterized protein n=1 Tax=Canavalia gladiata TaxID=3824 RepID=A0AAN9QE92_CANGL